MSQPITSVTSPTEHLIDSLPARLRPGAVANTHPLYEQFRSTYSTTGAPALILRPDSVADVQSAVEHARTIQLPFAVRSGGHGVSSTNLGGLVLDTSRLDAVTVLDRARRLVRVGAGARWGPVAAQLGRLGWAISSGDHANVGVGGLATGGGIGWLTRSRGLTIDSVRGVDLVLADGSAVRADAEREPELFWGVRGAGGRLGVVTSFDFAAAPVRDVGVMRVLVEVDAAGAVLARWAEVMANAPRSVTSAVQVFPAADGFVAGIDAVVENPALLEGRSVDALKRLGRVLEQHTRVAAYSSLLPVTDVQSTVGQQPAVVTNGFLDLITTEVASRLMLALSHPSRPVLLLRAVNGAVHDIGPSDTAFAHRHQSVLAVLAVFPPYGARELDAAWAGVEPHTDGA